MGGLGPERSGSPPLLERLRSSAAGIGRLLEQRQHRGGRVGHQAGQIRIVARPAKVVQARTGVEQQAHDLDVGVASVSRTAGVARAVDRPPERGSCRGTDRRRRAARRPPSAAGRCRAGRTRRPDAAASLQVAHQSSDAGHQDIGTRFMNARARRTARSAAGCPRTPARLPNRALSRNTSAGTRRRNSSLTIAVLGHVDGCIAGNARQPVELGRRATVAERPARRVRGKGHEGRHRPAALGNDHALAARRPAHPFAGLEMKIANPVHVHQRVTSARARSSSGARRK